MQNPLSQLMLEFMFGFMLGPCFMLLLGVRFVVLYFLQALYSKSYVELMLEFMFSSLLFFVCV